MSSHKKICSFCCNDIRSSSSRGTPATYATRVAKATGTGQLFFWAAMILQHTQQGAGFVATESRHTLLGCGYGLRRRHSLMRGMRRRPRRKEMAMGLRESVGLMGLMGLMGVVVVSVCFSVEVWVVWWLRVVVVRSVLFIFSRSRVVVSFVVSPSLLVWMRIVVVSLIVS